MAAVAINTSYVEILSADRHQKPSKGFTGSFSISSLEEQIPIFEGEEVVILSPMGNDLSFTSGGIITKVNPTDRVVGDKSARRKSDQKDKYLHNFGIEITKDLETNNLLSDLEYSLISVYRFKNPVVHFHQQYRELSGEDHETILQGWVYATRTVFGKLVNSIPRQNKLEFMLRAMDHFSTVDFRDISLYEGLTFLYKYIDMRILSRGKLIVETNNLIKQHLSNIVPYREIGFINPQNLKSDTLSVQADLFEELFLREENVDLRKYINHHISENSQLEQRFHQIFRLHTWPIDLSI